MRYLLYCSRDNGKEIHYLIDRKNDYWYVPGLHFPVPGNEADFHTDTLIDGELVIDTAKNKQIKVKFLVFDCLMLDGNSLMNRTLDKRIAYFKERFFDPYETLYKTYPEEIQYLPFVVEQKQMQLGYGIEMMFRQVLPNLPHGNDGLIFTCRNTEYKHGTDQHILKWKPEFENSIDFRLSLDFPLIQPDAQDIAEGITEPYPDYDAIPTANLMVFLGDNKPDQWYGEMYLDSKTWDELKALNEPLDDRVVECVMDAQKRWTFMRWRDDKKEANHITTVESVIESITDRVTERELILAAKGIKDAWKKRMADEEARRRGQPPPSAAPLPNGAAGSQKRKASGEHGGGRPSPSLSQRVRTEE
jgi:mRNA guanylyltransferase